MRCNQQWWTLAQVERFHAQPHHFQYPPAASIPNSIRPLHHSNDDGKNHHSDGCLQGSQEGLQEVQMAEKGMRSIMTIIYWIKSRIKSDTNH